MVSYEVGKTTSRIVEPRGQITRTSVAVLVDGKYEGGVYVPRPAEEIEQIKGIVMKAIGYDEGRGDQVEIANIPFKGEPAPPAVANGPLANLPRPSSGTELAVAAGALLLFSFLLLCLRGRKRRRSTGAEPQLELARETAAVAAEKIVVTPDPRREQLVQIAHDYHDATVRIIRTWLQDDKGEPKLHPAAGNGRHAEMN